MKGVVALKTNLITTMQETIQAIFKVASIDNHHKRAMTVQKLAKIHQIHKDKGYTFWTSLNTEIWEDNMVCFTVHNLYGVYQTYSNPVVISAFIDRWRIERILVDE